jgi:hypothetical protein
MEKKKIKRFFDLTLNACISRFEDSGVGPILSPYLNKEKVNSFCNEFNVRSKVYKSSLPIRVNLCVFMDNSFFFFIKGVSFFSLLKLVLNIDRFSYDKIIEINIFDFFFLCILNKNLILNKKKIFNKTSFLTLINILNSTQFLILKND